jgi:hypothetical protein
MSEQQAEQGGDETRLLGPGSAVPQSSDAPIDRLTVSGQAARNVESPDIVPGQDEAAKADDKTFELKAEAPKAGMPKAEPFTVQGFKEGFGVEAFKLQDFKLQDFKVRDFKVEAFGVDAPRPDTPKGDAPKVDGPTTDALKNDGPNPDTTNLGAPKADAVRGAATRPPRELQIMSPDERTWTRSEDHVESGSPAPKPEMEASGRGRRFAAMAAMLLLAAMAGAAGGALATIALSHLTETADAATPGVATLETSVGRIDADITALKAGLERTSNAGQSSKTGERLERIEKAQAEAAAKLAKLGDALDKLRAATSVAPTPVAAAAPKDVTGTVTAPAGAQALPAPQLHAPPAVVAAGTAPAEVGRLPTIEGWVLRDVSRGMALIEGRSGLYEVFAGDPVPGLGRVDAIRKQDGRWVVVTSRGLIVAR